MIINFYPKVIAFPRSLCFLIENLMQYRRLPEITSVHDGDIVIRGLRSADFFKVRKIISLLNNDVGFDLSKRLLYRIVGARMVFVAERIKDHEVVGISIFYFNARDRAENTIHEGFIGVVPSCQGKGLASKMRQHAIEIFKGSKLSGISTRISVTNIASFCSAEKMGFRVSERYIDPHTGEERCYLIRYFKISVGERNDE